MEIQDTESSSNMSSDIEILPRIKRFCKCVTSSDETSDTSISYSTESENEIVTDNLIDQEWLNPSGKQPLLVPFTGTPGLKLLEGTMYKEEDFYLLLVTEEMFQDIAEQTNLYATLILSQTLSNHIDKWIPTNKSEVKRLFGLLIWMGLVQLPKIDLYWSKDSLFAQSFPRSVMSRNRFKILLRMLHFANNENANFEDGLCKIKPIIDNLNKNYAKYYDPPEVLCIDESVIPFCGRVSFRQYMKQKRHRYGAKLVKLCSKPGYTHNFEIYCGKVSSKKKTTPKSIAISLCKNIFDKGHTLCIDNGYTSIDLAEEFVSRNTHVIGTIRSNCRRISKEVMQKKLQGEIFAKENKNGITLMKWKGKRNVLFLSTKHSTEIAIVKKNGYDCIKPKLVIDYNKAKCPIDIFYETAAYSNPLRKNLKTYRKVAFELLLNTSVVNAWILYNTQQSKSISIVEFKERLVMYLCQYQDRNDNLSLEMTNSTKYHEIKKQEGKALKARKRCTSCYKKNATNFGTEVARQKTIRVVTFCSDCPNQPFLCIPCFNKVHCNM